MDYAPLQALSNSSHALSPGQFTSLDRELFPVPPNGFTALPMLRQIPNDLQSGGPKEVALLSGPVRGAFGVDRGCRHFSTARLTSPFRPAFPIWLASGKATVGERDLPSLFRLIFPQDARRRPLSARDSVFTPVRGVIWPVFERTFPIASIDH
jgi:hypothetical protein